jgi:PleD family two-component response regulator
MNQPQAAKGDILIVDDTLPNLRLLSTMLMEHGYEVRGVPNGAMALTVIRSSPPDLILLDITMPGLDGYEVCQQLKADSETQDIPVIFISALGEILDKVRAFSVGGVDYVTKPFQIEEILVRIKTHLTIRNLQRELQQANEELARVNAALQAEIARR